MAFLQIEFMSRALGRSVEVKALLPSDHMAGQFEPPYRTLYFLPGYSASAMQLITYLGLRKQCELKGIAIILPDGENSFYQDVPERMTLFSTYVGKELVEETRKLLPLSKKREDTFIGGISMGGYGALYNGIRFNETFSKIVALSPATDLYELMTNGAPGFSKEQFNSYFGSKEMYYSMPKNLEKAWCETESEKRPKLFMCCGTDDILVWHSVKRFEKALTEHKVPHKFVSGPGNHELEYWEKMMDPAFSFLADIEEGTRNMLVIPKQAG